MCPALSSFGEAFEAKEVVAIYSLTKLGLLAQSPLEAETRTHLVLFRLVLLSKVLNHTTHTITGAVQGTAVQGAVTGAVQGTAPLSDIAI